MKQVRFASSNSSSSNSSNSNDAALPSSPGPSDAALQQVNQDNIAPQLKLLPLNDQIRELQTIIRDK